MEGIQAKQDTHDLHERQDGRMRIETPAAVTGDAQAMKLGPGGRGESRVPSTAVFPSAGSAPPAVILLVPARLAGRAIDDEDKE